jgi:nucleotide-binding universal stress UspA family protein
MSGSIVCGVGGSESARHAVRLARSLGSELGLRLVFVRAVEPGSQEEEVSAVAERLSLLSEYTTDLDRGAGWLVDVGHPAECLAAVALDEEARFIVVGWGRPHSSSVGSVSVELARRAPCPVVVVPPAAEARVADHGDDNDLARAAHVSER